MGSGSWSSDAYSDYSSKHLKSKSRAEKFVNTAYACMDSLTSSFNTSARVANTLDVDGKEVDPAMLKVGVRESRDSEEHPNTTPIIIAFDVTGSMMDIPDHMVSEYLPKLMDGLIQAGVPDPQMLFMAFGDHECDDYPIQAGQFESDTEKITKSLQQFYLEGGGGGNNGESSILAWIIAGYHTETDSYFKRGKKGFMFTISDEPCLSEVPGKSLVKHLKYEKGAKSIDASKALAKAQEQYHVFHIHIDHSSWRKFWDGWKEWLGPNTLRCKEEDINKTIINAIRDVLDNNTSTADTTTESKTTDVEPDSKYTY